MGPFDAIKGRINHAERLGLLDKILLIKSYVEGVSRKTSFVNLTDRELLPLAKCTVILGGGAVRLRG